LQQIKAVRAATPPVTATADGLFSTAPVISCHGFSLHPVNRAFAACCSVAAIKTIQDTTRLRRRPEQAGCKPDNRDSTGPGLDGYRQNPGDLRGYHENRNRTPQTLRQKEDFSSIAVRAKPTD
jgi:hypothetical protein